MSARHSDTDGSDIFWPGYVDAVTNLVLNLLFLLTVMTVAVFMFALELGRTSQSAAAKQVTAAKKNGETVPGATDPVRENQALKREIQRLNEELARRVSQSVPALPQRGLVKTVDATSSIARPQNVVAKSAASDLEVIVRFNDDAVALTQAEHDRLLESLKPIIAGGKSSVYVEVPAGFSEAKRMGYYRAMAVRNLLIEMKMPRERIDVSVHEGKANAKATIVKVRPH